MITISKFYFIDSTSVIPTVGDPIIGYAYFSVVLVITLFHSLIDK